MARMVGSSHGRRRSGRRVALVATYPERDRAMPQFISNHALRMVEATLRTSLLDGLELQVHDLTEPDLETLVDEVLAFDPDILACSAYLWSFPFLVDLARRIKEDDGSRLVVFGGPSARPSMLSLPPWEQAAADIDVLVINEGEITFHQIVEMKDRSREALASVVGVALPDDDGGWTETPTRPLGDLNEFASPYVLGCAPGSGLGVLQTYRGCPFTCTFCEWGTLESPKRVRNVDNLADELSAMGRLDLQGVLLVDAGLNLNNNAFKNLSRAADDTGFFTEHPLICEVYPARVRTDHIEFLRKIRGALVGVGLQSFDNDVLAHVERSYDEQRFEDNLAQLTDVASVAVEIIMGLPGDNPESFRRTFERARNLPSAALRVYHCVVLPSALMVRAPPHYNMDYDFRTLKLRSCLGWSEQDLLNEQAFLTREAEKTGGRTGEFIWMYPPPHGSY